DGRTGRGSCPRPRCPTVHGPRVRRPGQGARRPPLARTRPRDRAPDRGRPQLGRRVRPSGVAGTRGCRAGDMGTLTAAQLGHRLQLVRSLLWQESLTGDEYASILLGFHAGPRSIAAEGLSRSRIGAWLCTDRLLAERVLAQPGF